MTLSEQELLIYRELGDFFDTWDRHLLHTREHQALAKRIALAMALLARGEG